MSEPAGEHDRDDEPGGEPAFEPPTVPGKKPLTDAQLAQRRAAASSGGRARGRSRRSSSTPPTDSELRSRLREPIVKVSEWLADRNPELSRVLREDADKMAAMLAKVAASSKAPPAAVAAVRMLAVLLEPIDAFGRVLRVAYVQLRERRARLRAEAESGYPPAEPDEPEKPAAPPENLTPARFQVGAEPPAVN